MPFKSPNAINALLANVLSNSGKDKITVDVNYSNKSDGIEYVFKSGDAILLSYNHHNGNFSNLQVAKAYSDAVNNFLREQKIDISGQKAKEEPVKAEKPVEPTAQPKPKTEVGASPAPEAKKPAPAPKEPPLLGVGPDGEVAVATFGPHGDFAAAIVLTGNPIEVNVATSKIIK